LDMATLSIGGLPVVCRPLYMLQAIFYSIGYGH
jgi:hypothetical protein